MLPKILYASHLFHQFWGPYSTRPPNILIFSSLPTTDSIRLTSLPCTLPPSGDSVVASDGLVRVAVGSRPSMRVLRGVCLIVLIAKWTLSSKSDPSSRLALVIVRMVLWTNPVPVCKFGVHRMRFIFSLAQNSLNSLLFKQLPLSVRIVRGVQLSEQNFV